MNRTTLLLVTLLMTAGPSALAQSPPKPPATPAAPQAPQPPQVPQAPQTPQVLQTPQTPPAVPRPPEVDVRPREPGQPVNIRFDFTIIDEGGPQVLRKAITVTVADRQQGLVRSVVSVIGVGEVPISADVLPTLERDGKIRARISLDYRANPTATPGTQNLSSTMRLMFGVLLESGKKIVAARAADPVTDRNVSVEVVATVLK